MAALHSHQVRGQTTAAGDSTGKVWSVRKSGNMSTEDFLIYGGGVTSGELKKN